MTTPGGVVRFTLIYLAAWFISNRLVAITTPVMCPSLFDIIVVLLACVVITSTRHLYRCMAASP